MGFDPWTGSPLAAYAVINAHNGVTGARKNAQDYFPTRPKFMILYSSLALAEKVIEMRADF